MADGSVVIDSLIETGGFKNGLNDMNAAASKSFDAAGSAISQQSLTLATTVGSALGNMIGGIASNAFSNIVSFVGQSIETASSLQEVRNVVDTTFEDGSGKVNQFAKDAKDAYGLGELSAKKYASTIGAMFKSMGMGSEDTLDMSLAMTGLTADMASFYNLDFDTAFEKIRAGISGETEPLKQLGINMSVANLEAFALSEGITQSYDSMTQAKQATLRYNYLMSVTADAQGDFARTSEGYANQQRILATSQEELSAAVGEIFLPVAIEATKAMNELVGGAVEAVTWIGSVLNPPKSDLANQIDSATQAVDSYSASIKGTGKDLETSLAQTKAAQSMATSLLRNYSQIQSKSVLTENDTAQLKTIAQQIVSIYPDMAAYIDTTTGVFNTNTGAIQTNIDTLADQQKAMAYYSATQEYQNALLNAAVIEQTAFTAYDTAYQDWIAKDNQAKAAHGLYDSMQQSIGASGDYASALSSVAGQLIAIDPTFSSFFDDLGNGVYQLNQNGDAAYGSGQMYSLLENYIGDCDVAASAANDSVNGLYGALVTAKAGTAQATEEMQIATEYHDEHSDSLVYTTEKTEEATDASDDLTASNADATSSIKTEDEALKKLKATLADIASKTLQQIDSQVTGFEKIKKVRPVSAKSTIDALKSQKKYLEDYNANLELARQNGISETVLSQLGSGSVEDAKTLAGLVKANDSQIAEINDLYAGVTTAKTELADTITQNDEAYQQAQADLEAAGQTNVEDTSAAGEQLATTATNTAASTQTDATAAGQAATSTADAKDSIVADSSTAQTAVSGMVDGVAQTIAEAEGPLTEAGDTVVAYVSGGISSGAASMKAALQGAVGNAVNNARGTGYSKAFDVGKYVSMGVAAGINSGAWRISDALKSAIDAAVAAAKKALEINSPSKLFMRSVGAPIAEGIGVGITKGMNNVQDQLNTSLIDLVPSMNLTASRSQWQTLAANESGVTAGSTIDARQEINIYQPVSTPDETARAIRKANTYGLAGARR